MSLHADSAAGWLRRLFFLSTAFALVVASAVQALAQAVTPPGPKSPDDTPSIKIGAMIFADYRYVASPTTQDSDGNVINPSSFNVTRSYINVTGSISHIVAFRITPDITRDATVGSSTNGSLVFRIKYAYAQFNLDDWMPPGTWVRLGIQQTPYLDSIESIYRYRFQGTTLTERYGYLSSSDAGVAFRTALPAGYGDVQFGLYNGEGYSKAEANNTKSFQVRAGFRPVPRHGLLRGVRVQGFYTHGSYVVDAPRNRALFNATFEQRFVNAGYEYLDTKDRTSVRTSEVHGRGWSAFSTPKKPFANGSSIEALVRYDHVRRDIDRTPDALDRRWIGGIAYWFPRQGPVSAALMFDVDALKYVNYVPAKAAEKTYFVHMLIAF